MCVRVFMYCACVFVPSYFRWRSAQPMDLRNHFLLALCAAHELTQPCFAGALRSPWAYAIMFHPWVYGALRMSLLAFMFTHEYLVAS